MDRRISGLSVASSLAVATFACLLFLAHLGATQTPSHDIIISEVAWAGTGHSASDEWIELYNAGISTVDLSTWRLEDSSGDLTVVLVGSIEAGAFFLLERTADDTVSDVAADQIYTGGLNNAGETLTLIDEDGDVVDTANGDGGAWTAGLGSPDYVTMERVSPWAEDDAQGWVSNDGVTINGLDGSGNAIQGTPKAANSRWAPDEGADLAVALMAPESAQAGSLIRFTLHVTNSGQAAAGDVVLTNTLPAGLRYVADDSGLPIDVSQVNRPFWFAGILEADQTVAFALTATVGVTVEGVVVTALHAGSSNQELNVANNQAQATTLIGGGNDGPVLLNAVLYDGYEAGDADEAVQIVNLGARAVSILGWHLGDGSQETTITEALTIAPSDTVWLAKDAAAFGRQFGFDPDFAPASWPGFANTGDEVLLQDEEGRPVDAVVYEEGDTTINGWSGVALWPYGAAGLFAEEGQVLFRRLDMVTGLPITDSDGASDWAQMLSDAVDGRRVQYPGWNMAQFFQPLTVSDTEMLTIAVAPDNAVDTMLQQIAMAQERLEIETLTMENLALGQALVEAAGRGVAVTVLMEGSPAGGIDDQERFICEQVETHGGACWFMIRDDAQAIHDRYRYVHAKFMVIDGRRAVISSENLSPYSLPYDDKSDGTWGRRGLVLVSDSEGVTQRLAQIFADDLDPEAHQDLFRWEASHAVYGAPPNNFVPVTVTGGTTYTVRFPRAVSFEDVTSASLFQAPENVMRGDGLLALIGSAGRGDTILAQQLTERWHWGGSGGNAVDDPNPRLEAMINAARRGASVRLMLDSFFDSRQDPLSNRATCDYVNTVAREESLRVWCRVANPTGLGIHNKMILLHLSGQGWLSAGSWNGTEQSTKGNREVALLVQSDAAYEYLASMFEQDWPHRRWLPLVMSDYLGPANHPLISEILYDPEGADDAEFIEIVNPTPDVVDLSAWTLSDAVLPDDFEDARQFPAGTSVAPGETLVVALSASGFSLRFGFLPQFEILDSHDGVTNLIDDDRWGDPAAILQMGNEGDEVILRSPSGATVDVLAYGSGAYPGVVACPAVEAPGYALERVPYWRDSDNCAHDFRAWPLPSPGALP